MTRTTGMAMVRPVAFRFAALTASVAVGACLAGCGNGVEVRGPAAPSSATVVTPSPDGTAPSAATPRGGDSATATPTPAQTSTPSAAKSGSSDGRGNSGGGSDHNSGNGSGGSGGSGRGSGSGSGSGSSGGGGATSAPPTASSRPGSGHDSIAKCDLGDLSIGIRTPADGAAAGSQYVLISFTNSSQAPCTVYGYPGVSFVGFQNGTQLGKPAVRNHASNPQTVRLEPGSTKSALVQIAESGNFPPEKCQPTTSDGFRVYPPDSYSAAYVPFKTSACQSRKVAQLTVYPVGVNS